MTATSAPLPVSLPTFPGRKGERRKTSFDRRRSGGGWRAGGCPLSACHTLRQADGRDPLGDARPAVPQIAAAVEIIAECCSPSQVSDPPSALPTAATATTNPHPPPPNHPHPNATISRFHVPPLIKPSPSCPSQKLSRAHTETPVSDTAPATTALALHCTHSKRNINALPFLLMPQTQLEPHFSSDTSLQFCLWLFSNAKHTSLHLAFCLPVDKGLHSSDTGTY